MCKVHRACAFCELEGGQLLTAAPFVCPRSAVSTCLMLRGNSVVEEGGNFRNGVVVVLMVLKVVIRAKRPCSVACRLYL